MKIQWLGHSAFKLTGSDAVILIDPFLSGNPKFTGNLDNVIADVRYVLLTHAHNDHFGDTVDILKKTGATLIGPNEIAIYAGSQVEGAHAIGMNIGGTVHEKGFAVSMVQAFHSSSYSAPDGQVIYGGMPTGLIIEIDGHKIYHMGDTGIFSDMGLIAELHKPDIGIVPMGGHFTMDAETAALAVNRYFDFKTVFPCHYLTFPLLAQSAEGFASEVKKGKVEVLDPMGQVTI